MFCVSRGEYSTTRPRLAELWLRRGACKRVSRKRTVILCGRSAAFQGYLMTNDQVIDERDEAIRRARYDSPQEILRSWCELKEAAEARRRDLEALRAAEQPDPQDLRDAREALDRARAAYLMATRWAEALLRVNGGRILSETLELFIFGQSYGGGCQRFIRRMPAPRHVAQCVMPEGPVRTWRDER